MAFFRIFASCTFDLSVCIVTQTAPLPGTINLSLAIRLLATIHFRTVRQLIVASTSQRGEVVPDLECLYLPGLEITGDLNFKKKVGHMTLTTPR